MKEVEEETAPEEDWEADMEDLLKAARSSEAAFEDRVAERTMWISRFRMKQFGDDKDE